MASYNGYTFEEVKQRLETSKLTNNEKDLYLQRVKEVIKNEEAGMNLNYNECLKYSNFLLTEMYINA